MPEATTVWLVSSPLSHAADRDEMLSDLAAQLDSSIPSSSISDAAVSAGRAVARKAINSGSSRSSGLGGVSRVDFPEFKTGTLSSLLTLADSISKHQTVFEGITDKIVDTIRNLTQAADNKTSSFTKHLVTEEGQPYLSSVSTGGYLDDVAGPGASSSSTGAGWQWNRRKYRVEGRALTDIVDALAKDIQSLDAIHKQKQQSYNLAKGQLTALQRKRTGNLSTRDLSTVVERDAVPNLGDSEYLETVFVTVPKNSLKDFESKYERLAAMVVPRSAKKIAQDEEFGLYTVTIFRKVHDEYVQKCRENKFSVREYRYDEAAIEQQNRDLQDLEQSEKDLWTDLLRISRINFAEAYSLIIHLKVVASYVECVLRYGLPADYFICAVTPDPKQAKKALSTLQTYFAPFTPNPDHTTARLVGSSSSKKDKRKKTAASGGEVDENALVAEFQNLMEQEVFRFVCYELPVYEK